MKNEFREIFFSKPSEAWVSLTSFLTLQESVPVLKEFFWNTYLSAALQVSNFIRPGYNDFFAGLTNHPLYKLIIDSSFAALPLTGPLVNHLYMRDKRREIRIRKGVPTFNDLSYHLINEYNPSFFKTKTNKLSFLTKYLWK